MKILVLSLLRLGDTIMMTPALAGLRQKYESAQIDILVNSQFAHLAPLVPYVDNHRVINRNLLQGMMVDPGSYIFEPYDHLTRLIKELDDERYDLIINLTQSRMSARLMFALSAKHKIGMELNVKGKVSFNSRWFEFLNCGYQNYQPSLFHYSDIYLGGVNLRNLSKKNVLHETDNGKVEAAQISGQDFLLVQPLTSTEDKEWGFDNFTHCLREFSRAKPEHKIVILGAPFERDRLKVFSDMLTANSVPHELAIMSLGGALSLLKRTKILLSLDTSIKHMASATDARVLELVIGPSNLFETGIYGEDHIILRSHTYKLRNSDEMTRRRVFAKNIPPSCVAESLIAMFERKDLDLCLIAKKYSHDLMMFLTFFDGSGLWNVRCLDDNRNGTAVYHQDREFIYRYLMGEPVSENSKESRESL